MASYKVILKPSVDKDLRLLSKPAIARVVKSLEILAEDPFPRHALKLEGGQGFYRLRLGNYRIIYSVNQERQEITVQHVRHRREVYRRL
jgi:mRNA interferase RelE/StbE